MNRLNLQDLSLLAAILGARVGEGDADRAILSVKPFDPIPPEAHAEWTDALKELSAIDPAEIDTVFISVLKKGPDAGTYCEDCKTVHDTGPGVVQVVALMGDPDILQVMVRSSLKEGFRRADRMIRPTAGEEVNTRQ